MRLVLSLIAMCAVCLSAPADHGSFAVRARIVTPYVPVQTIVQPVYAQPIIQSVVQPVCVQPVVQYQQLQSYATYAQPIQVQAVHGYAQAFVVAQRQFVVQRTLIQRNVIQRPIVQRSVTIQRTRFR